MAVTIDALAAKHKEKGLSKEKSLATIKSKVATMGKKWNNYYQELFDNGWKKPIKIAPAPEKAPISLKSAKKAVPKGAVKKVVKKVSIPKIDKPAVPKLQPETAPKVKGTNNINTRSILSSMYAIVAWFNGLAVPVDLKEEILNNQAAVTKFFGKLGVKTAAYDKIINDIIKGTKYAAKHDDILTEASVELKSAFNVLKKSADLQIGKDWTAMGDKLIKYLAFESDGSKEADAKNEKQFEDIKKSIRLLGSSSISKIFAPKADSVLKKVNKGSDSADLKKLQDMAKALGIPNKWFGVPTEITKKYPAQKDKKGNKIETPLTEFYALRMKLRTDYLHRLKAIVQQEGDKQGLMDATTLRKRFEQIGAPCFLGPGFVGKVDEYGFPYSQAGTKIYSTGPLFDRVIMNPDYKEGQDSIIYQTVRSTEIRKGDPNGKYGGYDGNNTYPAFHFQKAAGRKLAALGPFIENPTPYRKKWMAIFKASAFGKEKVVAMMVELCYQLAQRIGTKAEGDRAGLTTLRMKNIKMLSGGKGFSLDYIAKDGVHQNPTYFSTPTEENKEYYTATEGKSITKCMEQLLQGRTGKGSENEFVFEISGRRITDEDTKNIIKKTCPKGFTNRSFRNAKATIIVAREFAAANFGFEKADTPKKQAIVKKFFDMATKKAGAALGHKSKTDVVGTTAITHYIIAPVMEDFLIKYGVPLPSNVQKALKNYKDESSSVIPLPRRVVVETASDDDSNVVMAAGVEMLKQTLRIHIR